MNTDKTPATLAVDVLAVMEVAARVLTSPASEAGARELYKARDAVAELIEVATEGRNETFGQIIFDETQANRLRAALARVKGESA